MPFKKENRSDFLPLAFLFMAWAWFHHPVLFGGNSFVLEDSSRFFFPLWKWGSEVWAKGWIPLWNPDAGFGTPYLADPQMAAWYPPVYLFYRVFNPVTAFNLLIAGHHLFALLGFYRFARKKGFSPWAALNGGILFGFSFNAISLTWACPMLFTYAWIPWIFMAANGVNNRRPGWFLFLSFTLAMQLAAGYPIFFYLTLLTLLLETVFDKKEGKNWKRNVSMGMGAIAIALLYNAAWLVPFREFIPFSNLAQRASYSESLGWSDLASWLNPFLKGHPLYSHPETPFSVTVYFVGLPLLVLLIWGISTRKVKFAPVFVFLAILVLSLGETAFLGGWLKTLMPGYSLLVRSGYWIPFVIWAALGVFLEAVTKLDSTDETNPKAKVGLWPLPVILVYGAALAAGVPWDLGSFWISLAFLLAVGLSRPFSPELRPIFLALAILFSLWPMAQSMNFTMDRSYYEDRPAILSQTTLPGRLYQSSLWVDSLKTISGDSVSDAYEKLKQAVPPNAPLGWDKEEVSYANSLFLKSFLKWYLWTDHTDEKTAGKLLDFLNVRYGIGPRPSSHSEFLKSVGNLVPLFENATMLPKWFSVTQALPLTEGQNTDQEILNPSFDLGEKCFVADEAEAGVYHHRIVEELDRVACRVHLKASGKGKGFLVSSETAYPGWRAQVNGVEKPVQLVNQAFRGIVLADGEEDVQINYAPTSFRLGCFLSLCICGLWFGAILRMLRGQHA
jgi:hypothetical protein